VIFYQNMPNLHNRTKPDRDGPWVGPFQNCVKQSRRPPFKMATVTKDRNIKLVNIIISMIEESKMISEKNTTN
jgi:hypothetical protein